MKTAAIGRTNRTYDLVGKRLLAGQSDRGFGRSGLVDRDSRQNEFARAGAIGGVETSFAQAELEDEQALFNDMFRFGFASPGQSSTGSGTTPGNMLGGALSGGMEAATLLYALNKMGLGGFGGGGGGSWEAGGISG